MPTGRVIGRAGARGAALPVRAWVMNPPRLVMHDRILHGLTWQPPALAGAHNDRNSALTMLNAHQHAGAGVRPIVGPGLIGLPVALRR